MKVETNFLKYFRNGARDYFEIVFCARTTRDAHFAKPFPLSDTHSITTDKEIDNEIRSYYSRWGFVKIIFVVVCESPTALRLYYCP